MSPDCSALPLTVRQQEELLAQLNEYRLRHSKLERKVMRLEKDLKIVHDIYENEVRLRDFQTREKEKHYMYNRLLLDVVPSVLMVLNNSLHYEVGTGALIASLFKFSCPDLLSGMPLRKIMEQNMAPASVAAVMKCCHRVLDEKICLYDSAQLLFANGHTLFAMITATPAFDAEGALQGIVLFIHDVTELTLMKEQAEAAARAKGDFLAAMSHEIRSPMNTIAGLSTLLGNTPLNQTQQGYVKSICDTSHSLLNIINDVLDLSRIDARRLDLICREYTLADLISAVATLVGPCAAEKNLEFAIDIDPALSAVYRGDDVRIHQILVNLLNNAVKYTQAGHLLLTIRAEHAAGRHMLRFEVQDTGIGIKQQDLPSVFTAFEQPNVQKNNHSQGTGLGLAISLGLARQMGGCITVRSVYGAGSVFTLHIPQQPVGSGRILWSPCGGTV